MKKILLSSALAIALAGTTVAPAVAAPTPAQAPSSSVDSALPAGSYAETEAVAEELLRLMNAARAKEDAKPLTQVKVLDTVAMDWSKKMADEGELYHNPDFGQQTFETGANSAAENVAWGSRTPDSPEKLAKTLYDMWMNSPGHRANIMNGAYNGIGFGVAIDSKGGYYATQNFGGYRNLPTD